MIMKDRAKFEKEMRERHIQENLANIKKRQQIGGQAYKEQKEKQKKMAAEKMFETEVLQANAKNEATQSKSIAASEPVIQKI